MIGMGGILHRRSRNGRISSGGLRVICDAGWIFLGLSSWAALLFWCPESAGCGTGSFLQIFPGL